MQGHLYVFNLCFPMGLTEEVGSCLLLSQYKTTPNTDIEYMRVFFHCFGSEGAFLLHCLDANLIQKSLSIFPLLLHVKIKYNRQTTKELKPPDPKPCGFCGEHLVWG